MSNVLEVRGLSKRYKDVWALKDLDLEVRKGEVFGFLGPNGAGKTTFTKCITGFVRPQSGLVRIMGKDALRDPTKVAPHIGLVPDQYDFYPNLTGRQHLDFYGRLQRMDRVDRKARIEEVLQIVRMEERADTRTKTYSHGMKQRICIAQAIMHRPDIILFDEPTNGLDPKGAYELREMIRGLAKDGSTVFLNSHLLNEVEHTCQRVAIMDRGQLKTVSNVADLRRDFSVETGVSIRLARPLKKAMTAAEEAAGASARTEGAATMWLPVSESKIPDVVAAVVAAGGRIREVKPSEASLEDVFLQLTEGGAD